MKKLWLLLILLSLVTGCFSQHKIDLTTTPPSVVFPGQISWNYIHAFLFKEDTSIVPNCASTGRYVKVLPVFRTGYGLTENDGFTIAGDSITIVTAGDYYYIVNPTHSGSTGDDFRFGIFKNSVKQRSIISTTTGATNFQSAILFFYFENLVAGDDISLKVANLTGAGTNDTTIKDISIFIYKIPE
jgi:hypothetical protein